MKTKKCKYCKQEFEPFRPLQSVCSPGCAILLAKDKEKKKSKKQWNKKKERLRKELMTLPKLKAKARQIFQSWIRERDKNLPCISCGKTTAEQWDGGHYLKAEIYSGLIFDERNVHKQCSYCNNYLAGNPLEYRRGLISRYGEEFVYLLEEEADKNRVKKYSKEELYSIIDKYK